MKILADENLYEPIVKYLREEGLNVLLVQNGFVYLSRRLTDFLI